MTSMPLCTPQHLLESLVTVRIIILLNSSVTFRVLAITWITVEWHSQVFSVKQASQFFLNYLSWNCHLWIPIGWEFRNVRRPSGGCALANTQIQCVCFMVLLIHTRFPWSVQLKTTKIIRKLYSCNEGFSTFRWLEHSLGVSAECRTQHIWKTHSILGVVPSSPFGKPWSFACAQGKLVWIHLTHSVNFTFF